jgi:hypothetical protein
MTDKEANTCRITQLRDDCPQGHQQGGCMSWQAYEAAKASWIKRHPKATPDQYEAAMKALAKKYRV